MLAKHDEYDVGYQKVGALHVHTDESKIDKIIALAKDRKAQAPEMGDVSKLSSEQVAHMFPLLTERLFAAYASGGAKVDGKKLSQALKRRLHGT